MLLLSAVFFICHIVGGEQLEKIRCKDIGCLEPWVITALLREQAIPRIVNNKHKKNDADSYNRDRIGNFFHVQITKSDPAADSYSGVPMALTSWRIPNLPLSSAAINQDLKIDFHKSEASNSNVQYVHIHHHYINLNPHKNKNTLITQYMQSGDDTATHSMPGTGIQVLPATNSPHEDNAIAKKSEKTTSSIEGDTDIVSSTENSSNEEYSAYNVPLN